MDSSVHLIFHVLTILCFCRYFLTFKG